MLLSQKPSSSLKNSSSESTSEENNKPGFDDLNDCHVKCTLIYIIQ